MGEPGARKEATGGFLWMVHRWKQSPIRAAIVNRVVIVYVVLRSLVHKFTELLTFVNGNLSEFVDGRAGIQESHVWLFDECNPAHIAILDLNQSCHRILGRSSGYSNTSNRSSADSLIVSPRPGVLSSRSM